MLLIGQEKTTNDSLIPVNKNLKFNIKQLIIPVGLCTYGIVAMDSDYLKNVNTEIREELKESIDEKITIDDFSQYAPAVAVYALNNVGIQGKNNLKDRSIIIGTSYLIMSGSVLGLKSLAKVERPDGSANNSFPSGHTATAFCGAEFLWQEYKDVNILYGISGYVVAAGTGFFRMYNNRHWLSDVVMGAGIGIISTKMAYWMYPYVQRIFLKSEKRVSTIIAPFYTGKQMGVGIVLNLK
jgi:hypothetical protein